MKNPLLDKEFLYELDQNHNKEVFAKIISLDFSENPIEEIVGRISQGSISIDSSSAIRRTCSLTVIANKSDNDNFKPYEYYWGLSQKIRVSVGVKNTINSQYPEIIWFPQGTFLITQFNTSQSINSYSISIQGKDKMALLNGEIGGNITALSVDFGTEDYIDENGIITNRPMLIKDIIMEVVHEYAKEPYHNIIINDLDDLGLQLMEYRGTNPLYLISDLNSDTIENMTFNRDLTLYNENGDAVKISQLTEDQFDHRINLNIYEETKKTLFLYSKNDTSKKKPKTIIKCTYGDVIGYKITDLVYAADGGNQLIGQVGNPVTSACLDKIIQMLGDFEYFYNLDGKFVFQKKRTYINTSFSTLKNSETDYYQIPMTKDTFEPDKYYFKLPHSGVKQDISMDVFSSNAASLYESQFSLAKEWKPNQTYYKRVYIPTHGEDAADNLATIYSFENSNLITSFQNNPDLQNIKNDFSIWGEKQSVDKSSKIPVHMRYAIDKKPIYYRDYGGHKIYISKEYRNDIKEDFYTTSLYEVLPSVVDWREIIYQMAIDYSIHGHEDEFLATVGQNNLNYYPTGYTGYEQYYTDMLSFWRQLYDPNYSGDFNVAYVTEQEFNENPTNYYWYKQCTAFDTFNPSLNYYILDLKVGYDVRPTLKKENFNKHKTYYYTRQVGGTYSKDKNYYVRSKNESFDSKTYWSKTIINNPENLNFWFDFLDTDGYLSQYSCHLIGNRPKAINDANVKAIYFRDVPTVILSPADLPYEELTEQKMLKPGFTFLKINKNVENVFSISGQGQCAKDKLNALLNSNACCAESVTMSSIPIYYLEPNTRVFIRDDESGINGEYIISRISYNLGNANTMSISATKALERIY